MPPGRAVYLDTRPDHTFGLLHVPTGARRATAVLIYPSFGWEDITSYRPRRALAEHLALAGHAALRIDPPGSGDSGGAPGDAGRLATWTDAVTEAATWLRANTGCGRVASIGIGLGGFVTCMALTNGADVDDLVLWGVPAQGRALVRGFRAFSRLGAAELEGRVAVAGGSSEASRESSDGSLEVSGFLLSRETRDTLEALDLTRLPPAGRIPERVLMLDQGGTPADPRLRSHFADAGAEVSVIPGPDYAAMTDPPQFPRGTIAEFEAMSAWLGDAGQNGEVAPAPPSGSNREDVEIDVDGKSVRETAFTVEQPFGRLFGVLSEPVGERASETCVVMWSPGAIRRIGPNRMWVEMARRWAARGIPSLRLDLEGIGDSDGDSNQYENDASLYHPRFADQTASVLDALEERGLPANFVLLGLCSGAYWSLHAALLDDRVRAAFMINLRALFWDETIAAGQDAQLIRELLKGSGPSWRGAARGLTPKRLGRLLRWGTLRVVRAPGRAAARRREMGRLDVAFDRLRDKGTSAVFVFGNGEAILDEIQADGRESRFDRWPNIRIERIPAWDHELQPFAAQREVHSILDTALDEVVADRLRTRLHA